MRFASFMEHFCLNDFPKCQIRTARRAGSVFQKGIRGFQYLQCTSQSQCSFCLHIFLDFLLWLLQSPFHLCPTLSRKKPHWHFCDASCWNCLCSHLTRLSLKAFETSCAHHQSTWPIIHEPYSDIFLSKHILMVLARSCLLHAALKNEPQLSNEGGSWSDVLPIELGCCKCVIQICAGRSQLSLLWSVLGIKVQVSVVVACKPQKFDVLVQQTD